MKYSIFFILVLFIQLTYLGQSQDYYYTPLQANDIEEESIFSQLLPYSTEGAWKKTLKSKKCVQAGIAEYKDLLSLIDNLKTGDTHGTALDIYNLTKRIGTLLANCDVLFCWKPTLKRCKKDGNPQGCEKFGLLVYPKCEEGYTNWECCVCATTCPENFTDNGLFCLKPKAYGRGVGYVLWKKEQCERDNPQGCEQNGLLWYPKCAPGFHNVGCCICSPDCPDGWTDIGISCTKPASYGRGVGYPITVGPQCLLPWNLFELNQQQGECQERLGVLEYLEQSVQAKLGIFEQSDEYPEGFIDEIIELTKLINLYTDSCIAPYSEFQDQLQ